MRKTMRSRISAALLALVMLLSLIPTTVFAVESATWEEVDFSEIQSTDTIAITVYGSATDKTYVLKNNGGTSTWGPAAVWDSSNTADTTWYWNIVPVEGGYRIYPAGSTESWLYCTDNNNGLRVGDTAETVWNLDANGYLACVDMGGNTRYMGVYDNNGGNTSGINPNFRTYKNITGNTKNQETKFYKLNGEGGGTGPVEPETITIAEALEAAEGTKDLTVKGVVTLVDGQNVYLQDATGGICVRMSSNFSDIKLGDTIIGTGKRADYNGLPQLGNSTYEKSSGLKLEPKVTTIGALTPADIGTYVTLQNVEVTEVYDNNGEYKNPNITVKDANGDTIQLYKAVVDKTAVAVGDVITITAAVSVYKTTLQLRNTTADEIDLDGTPAGPIANGDKVVIYNPAHGKALSGEYTGFYNKGTDVTVSGDTVTGFTDADVWTVIDNGDGTWSFAYDGKNIGMGDSFSSMPLGEKNDKWELVDNGDGTYYIKNTVRGAYMEWYADRNNWSSYNKINAGQEGLFKLKFYKVTGEIPGGDGELPQVGSRVVLYNLGSQGVLAAQNDNATSPAILSAAAALADPVKDIANGARTFIVEKHGEWYAFRNATDGYLCSDGTGNNAYYSKTYSEAADWKLEAYNGGFTLESRVAKFQGKYSQFLEFFGGEYKTYSMNKVTDKNIFTFRFLKVDSSVPVVDGVVNKPAVTFGQLADAVVGVDYPVSFTVEAPFGVKSLTVTYGGKTAQTTNEGNVYSFTIPGADLTEGTLSISVTGEDNKDTKIQGTAAITVVDEPVITAVTPAPGSQTLENKRPEISATVVNAQDAILTMTVNGEKVNAKFENGVLTYTPAADMADGRVNVNVKVERSDGETAEKTWYFTVGKAQYQLYFGQLHSHTTYSDGAGTLDNALDYVANLPESANVDFVAFTDHSNYFDASGNANPEAALYDPSQMTPDSAKMWAEYTGAMDDFNAENAGELVALGGFEMTWSGGPGHINTFNTEGIVSRNNTTLNNKTSDAGLRAYYALLSKTELADSISQFNHPGSTFGTFSDFAYWDAVADTRIQLVEVGNGEGQIGSGGYFPSYEYYTMALDKGWHVAPTNNQDNHKGKWGNANDARDVILADDLSEEGLYEAIRNYRVYSTEDKNLEVNYTVNGLMLGSMIEEVPEKLNIAVSVNDPDSSDSIAKVEVIVNSGKVAYSWSAPDKGEELTVTLDPTYSYYYIRVTQADGDLAVTAPVWVGESLKLGISETKCDTDIPVTGEELTVETTLFNSESSEATVSTVTYTVGSEVLYVDKTGYTIPASGTLNIPFQWTPESAKVTTITVTAVVELDDVEYTFTKDITLDVQDADRLVYIGVDASHYNEYVNGNYKDNMGNFTKLASEYNVRVVTLNTRDELIAAAENQDGKYAALILTAPSRRDGSNLRDNYATYSDDEIAAIAAFNDAGGTVILAGWSDYYEHYADFPKEDHMAAQQNKLLAALGSNLRIGDDATNDDQLNGGQTQRLYFSTYNWDNFLMEGVEFDAEHPNDRLYSQVFSQYGGASIYAVDGEGNPTTTLPDTVSPVVFGHASTYVTDSDNDAQGPVDGVKYDIGGGDNRLMVLATEQQEGKGMIIVSGAAFMSNFEVQATVEDNNAEKNYSNYTICENLLARINPVVISPIADVQAEEEEGVKFTIEGVATSNASGYDKSTAFFDCIYLQDATGGINAFPVAGNFKEGDILRITGTTSSYQGERQINVLSVEKIGETDPVTPKEVTAQQINDGSVLGQLVRLKGTVVSFQKEQGLVQTIIVKDADGNEARVFIDGYITTDADVKDLAVGCQIDVVGCASYDNSFAGAPARIRIRDRADIVCTAGSGTTDPDDGDGDGGETSPGTGDTAQPMVMLMVALTSAVALTGMVCYRRKRRNG